MSIIKSARKQKAIWWSRQEQPTDKFGVPIVCDPIEVDVRWDDMQEEFIDATGTKQMSKSQVMVDFLLKFAIGDYLYLGTLDSGIDLSNPQGIDDAWEIKGLIRTPNLKNTESLLVAML